jgi:retinol dehydrogenase-12
LTTIKKSASEFLSKESKLDVLWNNAGVMVPPQGSKTKQGYELQLGTNNVAPFLFTKLLTPILTKTAKEAPPGSVRVVWVSSSAAEAFSPKGGVDMENLDYKKDKAAWHKYGVSKAGNVLHAKEYARRFGGEGILSLVCVPALRTKEPQMLIEWIGSEPGESENGPAEKCSFLAEHAVPGCAAHPNPWGVY